MKSGNKKNLIRVGVILFWLLVWQVGALLMGEAILLPSPIEVMKSLSGLILRLEFVRPLCSSAYKIMIGFLIALVTGTLLAVVSYCVPLIKELLMPPMKVIKATPVASFVILALIWVGSGKLSILIAFLMVLPMIYTNLYQGLISTDKKLLEMADIFQMRWYKRVYAIYIPSLLPYLETTCSVGIGFCFKAGIAAEVIGIPKGSIGERLYEAKLYLMTKELFSWTILMVILSVLIEKIFALVIRGIRRWIS